MTAKTLLIFSLLLILDQTASLELTGNSGDSTSNRTDYVNDSNIVSQWFEPKYIPIVKDTIGAIVSLLESDKDRFKRQTTDTVEEKRMDNMSDSQLNVHELVEKLDIPNNFDKSSAQMQKPDDDFRARRNSDKQMEKIGEVKSTDRQSSKRSESPSESWSTQPISVEFRRRTAMDDLSRAIPNEEPTDTFRNYQPPQIDFVTSSRKYYSGERESRELAAPRQMYEDYDMHPVFRSYNSRGRDYQIPISRAMYPNRFKGDRDYYYRVPVDMRTKMPPVPLSSPYYYNRYRLDMEGEDPYMDSFERLRPTSPSKPKRIIYYATLPEIVRKPVDIRNHPRYTGPYPPTSHVPNIDRNGIRIRPTNMIDPTRRPYNKYNHPNIFNKYSNLDNWSKRPNQYEPISQVKYNRDEDKRNQERITDAKDHFQGSNSADNNKQVNLSKIRSDDQRMPWLMSGTNEDKENERLSGRNNFDRVEEYLDRNRYQNSKNKEHFIDQEMSDT